MAAICGAAIVHLLSLLIFVGILGTWLVSRLPLEVIDTVRSFILPAVIGAVIVQAVVSLKQPKVAVVALAVAVFVEFVLKALIPGIAFYATAIAVVLTVTGAWFIRDKSNEQKKEVEA